MPWRGDRTSLVCLARVAKCRSLNGAIGYHGVVAPDEDMTPAEKVERQWSWLLQRDELQAGVQDLVRAAYARPALRALFPFMSLGRYLRFSRTTREPYTWDYPYVKVDGATYQARADDNRTIVETGSLSEALDAVIRRAACDASRRDRRRALCLGAPVRGATRLYAKRIAKRFFRSCNVEIIQFE